MPEGHQHCQQRQDLLLKLPRQASGGLALELVRTVSLGDVVDELHDEHGLAHSSTAKEANLASRSVGCQQVNDL